MIDVVSFTEFCCDDATQVSDGGFLQQGYSYVFLYFIHPAVYRKKMHQTHVFVRSFQTDRDLKKSVNYLK